MSNDEANRYGPLPIAVVALFENACAVGYDKVDPGKTHVQLLYQGKKVGGWNRQLRHWYVSQQIANESHPLPPKHGFCWKGNDTPPHWRLEGKDGEGTHEFNALVGKLTDCPISR